MNKKITKAVIPVAGLGTRFLPVTKSYQIPLGIKNLNTVLFIIGFFCFTIGATNIWLPKWYSSLYNFSASWIISYKSLSTGFKKSKLSIFYPKLLCAASTSSTIFGISSSCLSVVNQIKYSILPAGPFIEE